MCIRDRSRYLLTYPEEKALFVNAQGQRFTRQGLWKLIKKYAKEADINKNINPTTLRHSFAIHLLNGGANVAVVSKILGNSNLSSLQLYLKFMSFSRGCFSLISFLRFLSIYFKYSCKLDKDVYKRQQHMHIAIVNIFIQ